MTRSPQIEEALAAGDNTLHGAIDYWQNEAASYKKQCDELQASVDGLIEGNLHQAKLLQAQQKMLLDAGIECGSKEMIAGMKEVERLKQQCDELLAALKDLLSAQDIPEPNCSCHIRPPCSDCMNYSGIREYIHYAEQAIAKADKYDTNTDAIQNSDKGDV